MNQIINFIQESIEQNTLSFAVFTVFFLCLFLLLWILKRRKNRKNTLVGGKGERNLDSVPFFHLENPTPRDEEALSIIEKYRKDIWYKASLTAVMKSEELLHLIQDLASDIARVYYPDVSEPMYEASIVDILELIGRVNEKIRLSTQDFPLNLIADRRISDVLKMKDYYRIIRDHPVLEFAMKNRALFRAGKLLWSAYNTANPWYWSRKIAYKATREAGLRYFYTLMVSQVGEETVKVYSKRNLRTTAAEQELVMVTAKDYEEVLGFVLGSKKLDSTDKIDLIRSLTAKKRIKSVPSG
jgi:hypothetical protein